MVEFTVGTMQKLVELLRPPEPEILQGEDLPSAGELIPVMKGLHSAASSLILTVSCRYQK